MRSTDSVPAPARELRIDADQLRANLAERLRQLGGPTIFALDLRGNAYGHGAAEIYAIVGDWAGQHGVEVVPMREGEDAGEMPLLSAELLGLIPTSSAGSVTLPTVLSLVTQLMLVKQAGPGEAISYGRSYVLDEPTRIGTCSIGYSNGVTRAASGRAEVSLHGHRLPVAGAISMDMIVLDLREVAAQPGDEVVLFGSGTTGEPTIADWAAWSGRPEIAVTTGLSDRLPRRILGNSAVDTAAVDTAAPALSAALPRPSARLILNRDAFHRNLASLRERMDPARILTVAKANAYGHTLALIAPEAISAGAAGLAVLDVDTALELRREGNSALLFTWMHPVGTDFEAAVREQIDLGVNARWQLDAIATAAERVGAVARIHLKLDTGLHRGGIDPEDWDDVVLASLEAQRAGLVSLVGCWTHLSESSHESDEEALARLDAGRARAEALGATFQLVHAAATGTAIDLAHSRRDLVRLGSACYGVSPDSARTAASLGIDPVLTMLAPVTGWEHGVATLATGFGDGLPGALLPDAAPTVRINGIDLPVLTIGVDELHVSCPEPVALGTEAIVFGRDGVGCETWGDWAGTVGEEMLAALPGRFPRSWV